MINKETVLDICNNFIEDSILFVVEVNISAANDIEIIVDSTQRVSLELCADLSKKIQAKLDEISDDYSLMVASAGIGSNLKDERQIAKTVGKPISVVTKDGLKYSGELVSFDSQRKTIVVSYEEKVSVEGKKRKELVAVEKELLVENCKSIIEELKIK